MFESHYRYMILERPSSLGGENNCKSTTLVDLTDNFASDIGQMFKDAGRLPGTHNLAAQLQPENQKDLDSIIEGRFENDSF